MHNCEWQDLWLDLQGAMHGLTERQREVVGFSIEGYTQKEIGAHLGIERSVVSRHWKAAITSFQGSLPGYTQNGREMTIQ